MKTRKILRNLFAALTVLLSCWMCAAVAYNYCALQWGGQYAGYSALCCLFPGGPLWGGHWGQRWAGGFLPPPGKKVILPFVQIVSAFFLQFIPPFPKKSSPSLFLPLDKVY